ncbi:hypothetical protein N7491_003170 [Penicillium cf. griseofulvum]|uniref:Uncharacterized protein n=1 Tax=Penicillium cf. griseofulvum TaxID=2972120 RepID=A0A9W9T1Q1_9EURO|nr:hypothetical protein N7472_002657 [Penicillium cf. griseofulvum]KAJ5440764.1 hypothetical protein N7491_003170 [Penicillium cf. griseofulvum]KAJ5448811.1 hypothetical protein N7445_003632 [Penicillium cf. griseofulvum]
MDKPITEQMSNSTLHRSSWGSVSSTFSNLEMSFSHDSCYGSDEVSVTSNGCTPGQSGASNSTTTPALRPFLKSILKNSTIAFDDSDEESDSESGYSSDGIDSEYDALSDESDEEDDGNDSDFSVWDETNGEVPETHEDHTESFDDAFISFEENSVRFDPKVEYIDSVEVSDEEAPDHQMTCHEMMMLARDSKGTQTLLDQLDKMDMADSDENDHPEFVRKSSSQPEEFSRDAVDLDCSLFVAYMNGIHGIATPKYQTYLRVQVDHIRLGKDTEFVDSEGAPSLYLDLVSNHVIGTFCNLLAEDELNDLITLCAEEQTGNQNDGSSSILDLDHHQALLNKIERFLLDRLANGRVDIGPDELSFFAGGIAHELGTKTLPTQV